MINLLGHVLVLLLARYHELHPEEEEFESWGCRCATRLLMPTLKPIKHREPPLKPSFSNMPFQVRAMTTSPAPKAECAAALIKDNIVAMGLLMNGTLQQCASLSPAQYSQEFTIHVTYSHLGTLVHAKPGSSGEDMVDTAACLIAQIKTWPRQDKMCVMTTVDYAFQRNWVESTPHPGSSSNSEH